MAPASRSGGGGANFSVVFMGSDFAVDASAALLSPADREEWHDCVADLSAPAAEGDDFSDLDELRVIRIQGTDRAGRCVVRVVGKFFPAPVIGGERLKRYLFHKLRTELPEGPFCILYMHSTVQSDDNNPGMSIMRGLYEELPPGYKATNIVPLASWVQLYWKIKYVSRLEYLWRDIKKGEVEISDFVIDHDKVLEHRPLTDYGIEPDPLHLADVPAVGYSLGRYKDKWSPEDRWYSRLEGTRTSGLLKIDGILAITCDIFCSRRLEGL